MNQLNTAEMALSGGKNGSSLINCGNKMAIAPKPPKALKNNV
ncbi:hypothetical protein AALB_2913 [Agarivorans albus MKT 106]|uniref:Uncharacterized protein n=1 Tax=Agarivorans albus MKT 106 TaxID=1331007 RepID=R9PNK0_AGAAL|nr:hypothetical protein AALB_2913 [Agarivorans albus MKT 106]